MPGARLPRLDRWDPDTYLEGVRAEIPDYELLQEEAVAATVEEPAGSILELGVGSGETARRLLNAHPGALVLGLDESAAMLGAARASLDASRVRLERRRLEDPLPEETFDLAVSVLAVHHLDGARKAELFQRLHQVVRPGGRFVLADLVVPGRLEDAVTPPTPGYDFPSTVAEELGWLEAAGFSASTSWHRGDLAVMVARKDRHA